jgi:hypothetical protein
MADTSGLHDKLDPDFDGVLRRSAGGVGPRPYTLLSYILNPKP